MESLGGFYRKEVALPPLDGWAAQSVVPPAADRHRRTRLPQPEARAGQCVLPPDGPALQLASVDDHHNESRRQQCRYGRRTDRLRLSTIITTNLDLPDWYELFQKKPLVDALLDRLQHRCTILRLSGASLRSKPVLQATQTVGSMAAPTRARRPRQTSPRSAGQHRRTAAAVHPEHHRCSSLTATRVRRPKTPVGRAVSAILPL